jgi:DNA repair protein RAD5
LFVDFGHSSSNAIVTKKASFQGSIIYAPETLKIQDDIYVSLEATLLPKAFQMASSEHQIALREESDSMMKRAKVPLLLLFERLGLTPTQGNIPDAVKKELQKSGSAPTLADGDSDEIDNSRLLDIYSKTQFWDSSIKGIDPAKGMLLQLRDYQRVALEFMSKKERGASSLDSKTSLSPLWLEYMSQTQVPFYFNPFTGKLTLQSPKEEHCTGGILADDMGLGKTIEILSLIHSHRATNFGSSCLNNDGLPKSKATLIVCPLNLLSQWRDEILRAFEDEVMTCELYYGLERGKWSKNYLTESSCPDVV